MQEQPLYSNLLLIRSGYFTFSNGKYEYYGSSSGNKVGGTNTSEFNSEK